MKTKKRVLKKKHTKKFNLLGEYKKSWKYLQQSKNYIFFIIGIFFFFALIGFFIPAPKLIYDEIIKFIKELMDKTNNLSQSDMILFIILNNLQTAFLNLLFGGFFGILPLLSTVANGYVLGFVSSLSVAGSGFQSLLRLLPHGIFEIPAIFISFGLGLKTGMFIFKKEKFKALKDSMINSLRVFLLIIIPLLIVAGIIEGVLISFLN